MTTLSLYGTCRESLDMAYQCIANEVMNTFIAKNPTILMAMSKKFLENYILKSPSNCEDHYLASLPLKLGWILSCSLPKLL